jgi:uncharacterized glyoxalase superfamily protein PhnB
MMNSSSVLWVSDVEKSLTFYTEKMGFTAGKKIATPDGRTIASEIHFGDTHLLLQSMSVNNSDHPSRPEIHVAVDQEVNMERLYTQMRMRGVMMYHDLQDEHWGERAFGAKDPNGYQFRFARTNRVRTLEQRHAVAS